MQRSSDVVRRRAVSKLLPHSHYPSCWLDMPYYTEAELSGCPFDLIVGGLFLKVEPSSKLGHFSFELDDCALVESASCASWTVDGAFVAHFIINYYAMDH